MTNGSAADGVRSANIYTVYGEGRSTARRKEKQKPHAGGGGSSLTGTAQLLSACSQAARHIVPESGLGQRRTVTIPGVGTCTRGKT